MNHDQFKNKGPENEQGSKNTLEQREKIIDKLRSALEANPSVFAFFLAGADAHNTVDEYSDIDIHLIIEDEHKEDILQTIETTLSNVDLKLEHRRSESDWPQMLYHVPGTSKFLIIDITLQTYSDSTQLNTRGKRILFDKKGVLKTEQQEQGDEREYIKKRINSIETYAPLRVMCLERELKRGNYLETLKPYHTLILDKVIEALRLLYCPQWPKIGLKHISLDLPQEIVQEIDDLYKVNSIEEIQEKSKKADDLLKKTLAELKEKFK